MLKFVKDIGFTIFRTIGKEENVTHAVVELGTKLWVLIPMPLMEGEICNEMEAIHGP